MRAALLRVGTATGVLLLCLWSSAAASPAPASSLPIEQCRLTTGDERDVSLGFDRPAGRVASRGTVHATVLLVDFADRPATVPPQRLSATTIDGVRRFLSRASYGRLTFSPDVLARWLRMPQTAAAYSAADDGSFGAHSAYVRDAIASANAHVDFSATDVLVIVAASDIGGLAGGASFLPFPGHGMSVDGRAIDNAVTVGTISDGSDTRVLAHEILHALGLPDLYAADAASPFGYTGSFGVMGDVAATSPSPTAWERWVLGWIDDPQIRCAGPGTSTLTLTPVERPGGTKALVVPSGRGTAVVVERRSAVGLDTDGQAGVIVYLVTPRRESGDGPIRLARVHAAVMTPLDPGQALTVKGVRVIAGAGGRISVHVPSRPA